MLKKTTRTIFCSDCYSCPNQRICLSGNRLTSDKRRFLLGLSHKQPANEAMKKGKLQHEEKQQGIKTLEEYGIKNFFKDLYAGKPIILKEARICSPSFALRGIVDILYIRYANGKYSIFIKELKTKVYKSHAYQLSCYFRIFSDRNCRIIYKEKKRKEKYVSKPLYHYGDLLFDIRGQIEPYVGKPWEIVWMQDNWQFSPWFHPFQNRVNEYRELMPRQCIEPGEIPPCKFCMKDKCYYWKFCKKYEENEYKKSKQKFLGKRNLLVSHPPKL